MTDFPVDNTIWPGAAFWGANFIGLHSASNVVFCDTHAKSFQSTALEPFGYEAGWNLWPWDGTDAKSGTMYPLWGTDKANPSYQ